MCQPVSTLLNSRVGGGMSRSRAGGGTGDGWLGTRPSSPDIRLERLETLVFLATLSTKLRSLSTVRQAMKEGHRQITGHTTRNGLSGVLPGTRIRDKDSDRHGHVDSRARLLPHPVHRRPGRADAPPWRHARRAPATRNGFGFTFVGDISLSDDEAVDPEEGHYTSGHHGEEAEAGHSGRFRTSKRTTIKVSGPVGG